MEAQSHIQQPQTIYNPKKVCEHTHTQYGKVWVFQTQRMLGGMILKCV